MGKRSTVYNAGLTANWEKVSKENKELLKDFIEYLEGSNHSPQTCQQYEAQLKIYFCWLERECENKHFTDVKKRELVKFFGNLQVKYNMSPNRIATIKSCISSMSNYIANILDDLYPDFRPIVANIPTATKETVRPKTVLEPEQVQEVLDILVEKKKYELACFLALLISSGCRRAEAIQMKTDFFVDENLVIDGRFWLTPEVRCKGKGVKGKQLQKYVIVEKFQKYLELWKAEMQEKNIKSEWLFPVFKDGNYQCASVSTANSWAIQISKITEEKFNMDYYPHSSRHYFVTYLAKSGYPDTVITKIVGWVKGSNLARLYDDTTDEEELEDFFSNFQKN